MLNQVQWTRSFQNLSKTGLGLLRSPLPLFSRAVSNIGKQSIYLPEGVSVKLKKGCSLGKPYTQEWSTIVINGPKGTLSYPFPIWYNLYYDDKTRNLEIEFPPERLQESNSRKRFQNALYGTTRALVKNAVVGTSEGHMTLMRLNGIGFRATVVPETNKLQVNLGYPSLIVKDIPEDIKCQVVNNTKIVLEGIDKQKITQFAASIKQFRKPEPYKGKGVFIDDETIKLKVRRRNK